jgi:microcompartment protein CcmL/EutN
MSCGCGKCGEVQAAMVDALEKALARARAGDVAGLVLVARHEEDTTAILATHGPIDGAMGVSVVLGKIQEELKKTIAQTLLEAVVEDLTSMAKRHGIAVPETARELVHA